MNLSFLVSALVFVLTIYLVFRHPTVKIPFASRYVHIDYGLAPLIGVAILFLTFSADVGTVIRGVMGTSVRPYSILIIIMSLSYLCISLDFTGFFEYISLRVARAAGNSGKKLFLYLFLLTAFLTLFTDNDVVILTMTLVIFYICKNSGADPMPYLFAQFFVVNIFGMALYIGNPTNLIAADAYGLSFTEFAKWMFFPSISAATSLFFLLWLVFRKKIPPECKVSEFDPCSALRNKRGAFFGSAMLVCTIFFMSLPSSWTGIPLWAGTLFFAGVMFLHDMISYQSKVRAILSRMPWKIVPFLLGLFIMVESLASAGWTDLLASQLLKNLRNSSVIIFGVCFLSSFTASLINNHPMTVLFVKIFQSPTFAVPPRAKLGSTLALIAGSNIGANLTLIGALAGIMWAKILFDKGYQISFSEFSKYGLLIMPFVIAVTSLALTVELTMWS